MHLLIPFAAPTPDAGLEVSNALKTLHLPNLAALLASADEPERDDGDERSLSPPHERALARALGLAGDDGRLPWAAARLAALGGEPGDLAWGELTPAHWHVGTDQVSLADPDELGLDEAASRAFLEAVRDLFETEGCVLLYGTPTAWYLAHESLAGLATASPDRVIGRNVDPWLPPSRQARLWRRLQNEVQMRLHEHPLNQAREARGQLPVNSVWLSGCGTAEPTPGPRPVVDERLRRHALAGDWAAWVAAWGALDAGPLAALRGADATLTLCGERSAAQWTLRPPSLWQRMAMAWRQPDVKRVLEGL